MLITLGAIEAAAASTKLGGLPPAGVTELNENELVASDGTALACAKSGTAGVDGLSDGPAALRSMAAGCCRLGFSNWKPAMPVGRGAACPFGRCSRAFRTRS